jgi:4-oxalocrotonate tautomerase
MFEGRTMEQKKRLVRAVTDAIVESLGPQVASEEIRIWIIEIPKTSLAVGGVLVSDRK